MFKGYMLEIVGGARDEYVARAGTGAGVVGKGGIEDAALLRNLVWANMEGGGDGLDGEVEEKKRNGTGLKKGLTDDESLSNVFVSLLREMTVVEISSADSWSSCGW